MKYKIGTKVKVISTLEESTCNYSVRVNDDMSSMKCNTLTIKSFERDSNRAVDGYRVLENEWFWTDDMLIPLSYSEPKSILEYKVTFNNPATIIHFEDGTKTVVKTTVGDKYNPILGFLYGYFEKTSGMSKTQCGKFFDNLEEEYAIQLENKSKKKFKNIKK